MGKYRMNVYPRGSVGKREVIKFNQTYQFKLYADKMFDNDLLKNYIIIENFLKVAKIDNCIQFVEGSRTQMAWSDDLGSLLDLGKAYPNCGLKIDLTNVGRATKNTYDRMLKVAIDIKESLSFIRSVNGFQDNYICRTTRPVEWLATLIDIEDSAWNSSYRKIINSSTLKNGIYRIEPDWIDWDEHVDRISLENIQLGLNMYLSVLDYDVDSVTICCDDEYHLRKVEEYFGV